MIEETALAVAILRCTSERKFCKVLIGDSSIALIPVGWNKKRTPFSQGKENSGRSRANSRANVVGKFSATDTIRRLNEKRPLLRLHRECLYAVPRRAFSFSPRPNLPLSSRLLSFSLRLVAHDVAICTISRSLAAGSANESARRRAFTAFLRHGGGCGRLGLLPPQRSYCFSHPNHPAQPTRQPPRARNHLPSPASASPRPSPRWRYHSIPSLLPPRRHPPCPWSRAQESARPPPTALCLEF